jgi:hypothetical protein
MKLVGMKENVQNNIVLWRMVDFLFAAFLHIMQ